MTDFLISTISQVFNLYNYPFEFQKSDVSISKLSKSRKDTFIIKPNKDNDNYDLCASCCIRKDDTYEEYKITTKINRTHLPHKQINLVGRTCLGALKTFYYAYNQKNVNKSTLPVLIEKSIESCIIAILFNIRTNNSKDEMDSVGQLLNSLTKWSYRTYEGRKIPFSLLIDLKESDFLTSMHKICSFFG